MKKKYIFKKCRIGLFLLLIWTLLSFTDKGNQPVQSIKFNIPKSYLQEAGNIPPFWITTVDEVNDYIKKNVHKGTYSVVGKSAGGRDILAVFYGNPREGTGTTTLSGSMAINSIEAYRGKDFQKTVYLGMAGVHGFELEGIMGIINLIAILETGQDLNGKKWPEIEAMRDSLDRIILLPLVNPDGRARVPIRMESYKGYAPDANLVHEYLNTGGKEGGKIIGWPDVKKYIPMDFSKFEFPGGYPNDNGVNIMHDDFLGKVQPETSMLLQLTAKEKPDLIMNMHTGVGRNDYFIHVLPNDCEDALLPVWQALYATVITKLTQEKLQKNDDFLTKQNASLPIKSDIRSKKTAYNLNTALNFNCGALSVLIEAPSHGYSGIYDDGEPVRQTPEKLLEAELIVHREAMRFLHHTGGRYNWSTTFMK